MELYICGIALFNVLGYRLVNTKCMTAIEQWKKIQHPNLVHLREVFTTKAFGDNCKLILPPILLLS
jgi:PAB-dependent poly(A)-specific ribonuclease subunit 3